MNIPIVGTIDERFLMHRLRSTSTAGIITAVTAILLFLYRYFIDKIWSWDLAALALLNVAVKMSLMAWYRFKD